MQPSSRRNIRALKGDLRASRARSRVAARTINRRCYSDLDERLLRRLLDVRLHNPAVFEMDTFWLTYATRNACARASVIE